MITGRIKCGHVGGTSRPACSMFLPSPCMTGMGTDWCPLRVSSEERARHSVGTRGDDDPRRSCYHRAWTGRCCWLFGSSRAAQVDPSSWVKSTLLLWLPVPFLPFVDLGPHLRIPLFWASFHSPNKDLYLPQLTWSLNCVQKKNKFTIRNIKCINAKSIDHIFSFKYNEYHIKKQPYFHRSKIFTQCFVKFSFRISFYIHAVLLKNKQTKYLNPKTCNHAWIFFFLSFTFLCLIFTFSPPVSPVASTSDCIPDPPTFFHSYCHSHSAPVISYLVCFSSLLTHLFVFTIVLND